MQEPEERHDTTATVVPQRKIGPYVLLRELGRGGAATVYKALDTRDSSVVALKALASLPYSQDDDQMSLLVRMERETRAVEGLSHPHIVRILDVGFAGDSPETLIPYFAMEFLSGETVRQRLDRDGALPLDIAASILEQAASALDAVHDSGIVHRDVKPGNLMLMKNNFVKLMDFGIARQNDDATVTRAGMMVGSPAYMSPEQAVGESATAAADIWGLGVVLYEMVCGKAPFAGTNIPAILYEIRHGAQLTVPQSVPAAVGTVILRALNRDPKRRYSRATGLAKAFREAIESPSVVPAAPFPISASIAPERNTVANRPKTRARSIHHRIALAYLVPVIVIAVAIGGTLVTGALRDRMGRVSSEARVEKKEIAKTAPKQPKHGLVFGKHEAPKAAVVSLTPKVTAPRRPPAAPSSRQPAAAPRPIPLLATTMVRKKPAKATVPPPLHALPAKLTQPAASRPLAVVSGQLTRGTLPQPMPTPGWSPTPAQSPDESGEPAAVEKQTPVDSAVSGVWHGTYANHPALLILNRPAPDDGAFDGTLTVNTANGAVVVDVRGRVETNGKVRFREQSVISGDSGAHWSLGSVNGAVNSGTWMTGGGKAADGHGYGWSFHR